MRKTLIYDIETTPMLAHMWSPAQGWVPHQFTKESSYVLCWSAKWRGESKVMSDVLTPEEAVAGKDDRIILSLAELIREADLLIAHNGDRFDIKKVNARVILNRVEPLGPVQTIDTLKLSRRSFGFEYHKLDYLAHILLQKGKIKTDLSWWLECMAGDEKALARMERYNRKDVRLLEEVFDLMLPYVSGAGLPRLADTHGMECPYCGNHDLQSRGTYETNTQVYRQYWCSPHRGGCGRYPRARHAERRENPPMLTVTGR